MPTEWSYAGHIEKSGGVLYDIRHDDEKFLKKASLVKSYADIDFMDGKANHLHPFDLGDMTTKRLVRPGLGNRARYSTNTLKISNVKGQRTPDYYYKRSHRADMFFAEADLAGSGQELRGYQTFQFTETSNSPRHETGGVAAAGRFYPTIDFSVSRFRKHKHLGAVKSLRFDFWLEPDLREGGRRQESVYIPLVEQLVSGIDELFFTWNPAESPPHQAGLFRDRDQGALKRLWQSRPWWSPIGLGKPGEQIFDNAEKPLIWEVAADGIRAGATKGTWDNIHIWSYSRNGLVSTPGMPFGIHMHWRWAAAATNKLSMAFGGWTPDGWIEPELAGRGPRGEVIPGGPLIDPRSPETDLRVAWVQKSTAEKYAQKTAATPDEFESLLRDIKTKPEHVSNRYEDGSADEMVLLVSIVVYRPDINKLWHGSVFPHGIFFPHAHDLGYLVESAFTVAGAYDEQYLKRRPKTRQWNRNPS